MMFDAAGVTIILFIVQWSAFCSVWEVSELWASWRRTIPRCLQVYWPHGWTVCPVGNTPSVWTRTADWSRSMMLSRWVVHRHVITLLFEGLGPQSLAFRDESW